MIKNRLSGLRIALGVSGADAFVLANHESSGQPSTRYLSGFSGSESVLVITKTRQFIIADGRYYSQVEQESGHCQLVKREKLPLLEILKGIFRAEHVRAILIDGSHTHYSFVESALRVARGIVVKNEHELLHRLRIVKDEQELRCLQKAADISIVAFKKLLPLIRPGASELWLAARLEMLMKENGSLKNAFDSIVASGKNGAWPHAKPTSKKIKKGELITFDFGASFNGYMSDMTRTVAVGAVSSKLKEIYETVRVAQELGCKKLKAGISGKAVDDVCRKYLTQRGYGAYFLHSAGHGLGMSVHELPVISPTSQEPLPINSVVTVEPGIYIEGVGGVRIEDALIVTKTGGINLHKKMSKNLIQLPH